MSTPAGINNATHKHSQEEDKSSGRQTKQMQSSGKMNDHTDGTTASTVSKTASYSTHAHRFRELEAQIKLHQQSYDEANAKIDNLQDQLVKTMEVCAASSLHISNMRNKLNDCASANQVTDLSIQVQTLTQALTLLSQQIQTSNSGNQEISTAPLQITVTHPEQLIHQTPHQENITTK